MGGKWKKWGRGKKFYRRKVEKASSRDSRSMTAFGACKTWANKKTEVAWAQWANATWSSVF